jgi:hypothetical protein
VVQLLDPLASSGGHASVCLCVSVYPHIYACYVLGPLLVSPFTFTHIRPKSIKILKNNRHTHVHTLTHSHTSHRNETNVHLHPSARLRCIIHALRFKHTPMYKLVRVCMRVYLMYVCAYICVCIHVHVYICVRVYTRSYVHMYIDYPYIHAYIQPYMHACMHTSHSCIYTYIHIHSMPSRRSC